MQSEPDFTRRVEPKDLPELMDEPCSYEEFRACLVDLRQVNQLTFSYRPTLAFISQLLSIEQFGQRVSIVDVGFGAGDMLRQIERWAKSRTIAVELVGIDLNPYAAQVAKELSPANSRIEWLTGDAYSYDKPVDVVISSLFTHHLAEEDVVRFIGWSDAVARRGWFVNDLFREKVPYTLFSWLAKTMRWHRFVQHDGPVSFLRSFREEDWLRMLGQAGVDGALIKRWTPGRLCVGRMK